MALDSVLYASAKSLFRTHVSAERGCGTEPMVVLTWIVVAGDAFAGGKDGLNKANANFATFWGGTLVTLWMAGRRRFAPARGTAGETLRGRS